MSLFSKAKFKDPAKNPGSTAFEVNNWVTSEFIVSKLIPAVGVHPFPLDELSLMTAMVCKFKPQFIFEWGTNIGKSARAFREIVNAFDIDCHIHSIDLPDDVFHNEHPKGDRGKMVRGKRGVTLHQADGIGRSMEIIEQEKPKGRVMFFVDGDHSYESVHRELSTILSLVPDAVVLLHDTFYQSVDANYNIGPYKAINDVLEQQAHTYTRIETRLGLPGMTAIFK